MLIPPLDLQTLWRLAKIRQLADLALKADLLLLKCNLRPEARRHLERSRNQPQQQIRELREDLTRHQKGEA